MKLHNPFSALDSNQPVGATGGPAISLFPVHVPGAGGLALAMLLGIVAQFLISLELILPGAIAYTACAAAIFIWARRNPGVTAAFLQPVRFSPRAERWLFAALVLLTAAVRYLDLGRRVYGLEGDESKWTVQSWYSVILGVWTGQFARVHYIHLPVDFWVRSFFLRLFGLNFISARIESATLGVISVVCVYLIVRKLADSPGLAWLSALLYSLSFMELNASHQALHDTPPAGWMMAALLFLVWGIRGGRLLHFQIAGILLGLGMLTYETFYPTPLIAAVLVAIAAAGEVARDRSSLEKWSKVFLAIGLPVAIVYLVFTHRYLGEQSYHFDELRNPMSSGLGATAWFLWQNVRDILTTTFARVVWTDSLVNWRGPLLNPMLLPFMVTGFALGLTRLRDEVLLFVLLWYLGMMIPAPVMLGAVWPRILFMAAAPLLIWAAIGLWAGLGTLRTLLPARLARPAAAAFGLLVLAVVVNDYRIFSVRLLDPVDRQKRRELADLTYASAATRSMILFPYWPKKDDPAELEGPVIEFSVAGARHLGSHAADGFRQLPLDELLSALWGLRSSDGLDVIFDRTTLSMQAERANDLNVVLACYPQAVLKTTGRFFDVYSFDPRALAAPVCYSPPAPSPLSPADSAVLPFGAPVTFQWTGAENESTSLRLKLERQRDGVDWIEVEDAFQGPGWIATAIHTTGFNGSGYLEDNWQADPAVYTQPVSRGGAHAVWVRSYKRRDNDQYNYLAFDGHRLAFAENGDALDAWTWKKLGTFELAEGGLPISLIRTYGQDVEYSVFVDSLVITSDLTFRPDQGGPWVVYADPGEIPSDAHEYAPPAPLAPGSYRWSVRLFRADQIVDFTGMRGVESPASAFTVSP